MCDATWLRVTLQPPPWQPWQPLCIPLAPSLMEHRGQGVQALCFGAQNEFKLKSCEHFVAHKWGGGGVGAEGGLKLAKSCVWISLI